MNWYVLYVLSYKTNSLIRNLNRKQGVEAFSPKCEYYRRKEKDYAIKPLFSGYIFVKTSMEQKNFNYLLQSMDEERNGLIRQLVNKDISALTDDEIDMFNHLLNSKYTMKLSKAYVDNNKLVVYEGPLQYFQENIVKIDKHNQLAFLDLSFMDRKIKAGLVITSKK